MSTLDVTDEVPSEEATNEVVASDTSEEPNITTTVEDVVDEEESASVEEEVTEEPAASETAASETVSSETAASETVEESDEVKSSDNDLENRVKELEEKLNKLINIISTPSLPKSCLEELSELLDK